MNERWLVRLGAVAFVLAVAGFATVGLSQLVVAERTATVLGAPLLVGGFLAAVGAFVIAVLLAVRRLAAD